MSVSQVLRCGIIVGVLLIAALLTSHSAIAQERSFTYERIDVTVDVSPNGMLTVTETMTLDYQGGSFTTASRDIALQRLDDIHNITLQEGERAYAATQTGTASGTYTVERRQDAVTVQWFYPPSSFMTRTFTLRYQVDGAVRVGDEVNQLWWIAIFPERSVAVQQSSVTVRLPEATQLQPDDVTLPAATGQVSIAQNVVTVVRDTSLPPGMSLDVQVQFAPGLVQAETPTWQTEARAQPRPRTATTNAAVPTYWFIGAMVGILGGVLLLVFYLTYTTQQDPTPPRSNEHDTEEKDAERAYRARLRELENASRAWQTRRPRSSPSSRGFYIDSSSGGSTGGDSGSFWGGSSDSGSSGGSGSGGGDAGC